MDYYNPADLNAEDLIKRINVGRSTEELIRTPTGLSVIGRAIQEYREGIQALEKMATSLVGCDNNRWRKRGINCKT